MAGQTKTRHGPSLEDFLRLPGIEEPPTREFLDGRIVRKAVPRKKHALLTMRLLTRLNEAAEPTGLGLAFPELRCTYAGRSIVPDIAFLRPEHIELDPDGEPLEETLRPPDIHIEILSPEQPAGPVLEKREHSTAHGCPLGWFLDPVERAIEVHRPGRPPERLSVDGVLEGEPVLPGFRLPVVEVFGWLGLGKPAGGPEIP